MKRRHLLKALALCGAVVISFCVYYVRTHPLVFNESFWGHAHCMPQAGLALSVYAHEHGGAFPIHTNGYGDALLQMPLDQASFYLLTGPGFDTSAFQEASASGGNVDESRCGRVYVQGLNETNDARIAILFDKVAAPPDHSHFLQRLWHGFVREVCFVDGSWHAVPIDSWPEFAREQVELLVQAGFAREHAQALYNQAR